MDAESSSGRKQHRKSRFGCAQCKTRRVKCDEQRPACSNCVRRSAECIYPPASRARTASATGSSEWSPTSFDLQDEEDGDTLDMAHLELFHHFLTDTYYTLTTSPDHRRLWRTTIPNDGFTNPFLMHGIFAVSAQHLSIQRPERHDHYSAIARKHNHLGLRSFHLAATNVSHDNCNILLSYSLLVVVLKLTASPAGSGGGALGAPAEVEDSIEWLQLIRGIPPVLSGIWQWIVHGELAPLPGTGPVVPADMLPPDIETQLSQLFEFCKNSYDGDEARSVYELSLSELRLCFLRATSEPYQPYLASIVFVWPTLLPEGFMAMLRLTRPEALAILAHYLVLLHKLEGFWWAQGTALRLLTSIERILIDPWRYWIRWPMEQITGTSMGDVDLLSVFPNMGLHEQ